MDIPPSLPPKPEKVSSNGKQSAGIFVPGALQRPLVLLPIGKLQEFEASMELMRGYLSNLDRFKAIQKDQTKLIEQQINRLEVLLREFSWLNSENSEKNVINLKLQELHLLEKQYRTLEATMFQKLQNYQVNHNDVLRRKLESGIKEEDQLSQILVESVVNDDNVAQFVEGYQKTRTRYHYRSEVLKRLQEDRIGGVL
ncbi:hypothetical protein DASC09_025750 [Saccharomycopsis crataegensis]|uniref:VPS37 C-terminal domain-containing protein n=1 Tax=Saccharomycopsis crataegensis TaxID=43959 RepID=A0AAV5QL43_9ASCO|nr:hypothetical protein DASC09_025750 [Saccharomycopsis crataegensis]